MSCYYIIKSPGGGPDIKIPAGFGLIVPDEGTSVILDRLKNFSNKELSEEQKRERENISDNLTAIFRRKIPLEISSVKIKNLITRNLDSTENIVTELNNLILGLGNYNNIQSAIYKYGTAKKGNIEELMKELDKPIKPKYFVGLSLDGIIGSTNIKQEQNKIRARLAENLEFGFSTIIPENVNEFINGVINGVNIQYKQLFESNVLLGTSNTYGGRALNIEGFTFFNTNDDLSLFLGIFKRVASDINKEELYKILEDFNKDIKFKKAGKIELGTLEEFNVFEFFNGTLSEKGKLTLGGFDQLLDLAKADAVRPYITRILKLVSNHLKPDNTKLYRSIRTLFETLSPEKYGSQALRDQLLEEKFVNNEINQEIKYKNKLRADFLASTAGNRDEFFAARGEISENLFHQATSKIIPNQDIVLFPIKGLSEGVYGVVTGIYPRESGVEIRGVYRNQFGEAELLKQLFKDSKDTIIYRSREDSKELYNSEEIIVPNNDGLVVSTKTTFPQELVKRLLSKGDRINKDLLVLGVQAGSVVVRNQKGAISEIPYSKVKLMISAQAKIDVDLASRADSKHYTQIHDGELLSEGDLFIDPGTEFYKQVLYTDKDNVYSWIQQEDKDTIIKATPRKNIKQGLVYTFGQLTLEEMNLIESELGQIGSSSALTSSFTNTNSARKGDYFVIFEGSKKIFGKVTYPEASKGIIFDSATNKPKPIIYSNKNIQFFTTRNIASNFSMTVNRVNNWKIHALSEDEVADRKNFKPVNYVVPKWVDVNTLMLLPGNGYANIGGYKVVGYGISEGEKLASDWNKPQESAILRLMRENGVDTTGLNLYIETDDVDGNSAHYKRDLYTLHKINNFDSLPTEIKRELDILHPGTYFSVYTEGNRDFNIYRIMNVTDDIVTAHLNKISKSGQMITVEKEFKISDLLRTKSPSEDKNKPGTISDLYLQYGNSKFSVVIKAINEKLNLEQVGNQKAINKIAKDMRDTFRSIGVSVRQVSAKEGNFTDGQHAKIETSFGEGQKATTAILLNKDSGLVDDLVHETLHVYLTLLRYNDLDLYGSFIDSVVNNDNAKILNLETFDGLDVTAKEEAFVKIVSKSIKSDVDFLGDNLKDFTIALATALKMINPDIDIEPEELDYPLTLLNKPLKDLFDVTVDNSHPLFNLSLISTEPMMREWMTQRGITLKC